MVKSTDPKLWTDDRVTILSFHVDNPVFVRRLIRKGMETKDLVLAKVSGLERIEMEDQTGSATNTVRTSDTTGVG